ncbi:Myb-like DNA-binding domain containing protein [Tritrichomonas foetus]|uniref:Myb-like DNA-binding domain containing protein n=1 Tax=Tritrichomonas foetus TaxID=1144522 RepID=A0A1J4JNF4_9EUKA|nr:Myb-like DNA-binding domain containing protein [Tritrichomonas foetus]|eukprot:OHT00234.1 Myb-like DNA-binding domain containing protein [Tritrichomonas foetus]
MNRIFKCQSTPQYHYYSLLPNKRRPQMMQNSYTYKGRSKFTDAEDSRLKMLVSMMGENNWISIAQLMNGRNSRQCKERWTYHLSPEICHNEWSIDEDRLLLQKFDELGPRWKLIKDFFNGRTDAMVKNRYNKIKRHQKKFAIEENRKGKHIKFLNSQQQQIQNHFNNPIILDTSKANLASSENESNNDSAPRNEFTANGSEDDEFWVKQNDIESQLMYEFGNEVESFYWDSFDF